LAIAEAKSEREVAKSRAGEAREIKAHLDSLTVELDSARSEVVRLQQAIAGMELAREAVVSRAVTAESAAARARDEALQLSIHLHEAKREIIGLQATAEVSEHSKTPVEQIIVFFIECRMNMLP
jgi:chromosome segregation ATPase